MKECVALLLMFATAGLCGCSFYWNHDSKTIAWKPELEPLLYEIEDRKNSFNIGRLEKGMTTEDVYGAMGMPDLYGDLETADEEDSRVFFYYTGMKVSDESATGEECTPLVIVDGKLAGWGKDFYGGIKRTSEKKDQEGDTFER